MASVREERRFECTECLRVLIREGLVNFSLTLDEIKRGISDEKKTAILKAWRVFAIKHHPDKGGDVARFQTVNNCVDILIRDPAMCKSVIDEPPKKRASPKKAPPPKPSNYQNYPDFLAEAILQRLAAKRFNENAINERKETERERVAAERFNKNAVKERKEATQERKEAEKERREAERERKESKKERRLAEQLLKFRSKSPRAASKGVSSSKETSPKGASASPKGTSASSKGVSPKAGFSPPKGVLRCTLGKNNVQYWFRGSKRVSRPLDTEGVKCKSKT